LKAEFVASAAAPASFPRERLPEIAFLGRSNVGKSSLINALVGQKGLAFTSAAPGRTQTINFYRVEERLFFVDLPGYGFASVSRETTREWKRLIEGYLLERETFVTACMVLDARRGWMASDLELRRWLEHHGKQYLVVATKADKFKNQSERERGLAAFESEGGPPLPFSALTGRGVRELWQAITKTLHPR
jgi:GTP-binding protein